MEEWKSYKLGDISDMKYGKLPPEDRDKGTFPIFSGYKFVGWSDSYNCDANTIIVVARGVGGTGEVKITKEKCYLTNLSIAIVLNGRICIPEYFYYKFQESNFRYLDSGSAQSQITIDDLKRVEISLPSIKEQKRVVTLLSALDAKIELNNRINHNLEEQAQALYKSWFVDFEPFKDGEFVESELGMIPKGWRILPFKDFLTPINQKVLVGTYPEYSVTNDGIVPRSEKFNKQLSKSTSLNKVLKKHNLVFGMSRDILNWGIMLDDIGGVSSAYNIYEIDDTMVNPLYLKYYMKYHIRYFNDLIGTAAREGQSLDKGALMQKKALVPFANTISSFFEKESLLRGTIATNRLETSVLEILRDGILPSLMSGKLNINELDC